MDKEYEQNIEIMKDLRNRLDTVINGKPSEVRTPDPKKHFQLSMFKSVVRIAAGIALCTSPTTVIIIAGVLLIIAELVGILEEMV